MTSEIQTVSPGPRSFPARLSAFWQHGDRLFNTLVGLATLLVLALVLAIGYQLWANSALSRQEFGFHFLFSSDWDPAIDHSFGALPFIAGTLVTSLVALIISVPVSLGVAIFLAELAPNWLRQPLSFLVELLAAVPSVIYGLWGLFVFVPWVVKPTGVLLNKNLGFLPLFTGPVFGPSRLAASLILAIMIGPTITAISRDVFRAIPSSQREAALALGATRWEMISQVLAPYGLSGLLGAVILGLGRALGETIAVTMVIGNNLDMSASLLHPGYTMASIIANEFAEATDDLYLHALIEIGLILFVITLALNLVARFLIWRVGRKLFQEGAGMNHSKLRTYRRKTVNGVMLVFCSLAAFISVLPLIWILGYVIKVGAPALSLDFFTQLPTPVGIPGGGIINAIAGSAITVGLGLLFAAPVGVLAAFHVAFHPNTSLALAVRFGTDVISGVPSIVMGIFAYTLIVLPQRHFSAFAGGAVLSFIMLPIIIRSTEEMLKLVPGSLREGSLALGAPEWKSSLSVVLPAAANGVLTGVMLAIARAAGEAAPMLFTAFGNPFMSANLNQPIATLPHTVFVYAISPYEDWRAKAWATGLVLIALVLVLNILARGIVWLRTRRLGSVIR